MYRVVSEASQRVREQHRPVLVEAVTYRFRGHSMADPEEYRTKEEVDPVAPARPDPRPRRSADRRRYHRRAEDSHRIDAEAVARVDEAVAFAESSRDPAPESLYDDVYVLVQA